MGHTARSSGGDPARAALKSALFRQLRTYTRQVYVRRVDYGVLMNFYGDHYKAAAHVAAAASFVRRALASEKRSTTPDAIGPCYCLAFSRLSLGFSRG